MPAQGRKMFMVKQALDLRPLTPKQIWLMLRNVVANLIIHGSIKVTTAVSKTSSKKPIV